MMKKIFVNFTDFWGGFNPQSNFIIDTLRQKYIVEISNNPDYLFCSAFGLEHLKYNCIKIQFIGENIAPDFNSYDYAIGFNFIKFGDRYLRLPLFMVSEHFERLKDNLHASSKQLLNRNFCSIVVSNAKYADPIREYFFKTLSKYKRVDSGGKLWNNIGGPVADKLSFISQYKFNIAFENSCVLGYTTEKIMDAMVANTMPIYWGNPLVNRDFNEQSFVNIHNFSSVESAIEHIIKLDNDDELYLQTLLAPNVLSQDIFMWREHLLSFLSRIIDQPIATAKYIVDYGMMKEHHKNLQIFNFFANKLHFKKLHNVYTSIFHNSTEK